METEASIQQSNNTKKNQCIHTEIVLQTTLRVMKYLEPLANSRTHTVGEKQYSIGSHYKHSCTEKKQILSKYLQILSKYLASHKRYEAK